MKTVILLKGSNCAPCRMFQPVFEGAVEDFLSGEMVEVRQEVDNVELMKKFGVRTVPSVVLVDVNDGKMDVFHVMTGSGLRKEAVINAMKEFVADDGSF